MGSRRSPRRRRPLLQPLSNIIAVITVLDPYSQFKMLECFSRIAHVRIPGLDVPGGGELPDTASVGRCRMYAYAAGLHYPSPMRYGPPSVAVSVSRDRMKRPVWAGS